TTRWRSSEPRDDQSNAPASADASARRRGMSDPTMYEDEDENVVPIASVRRKPRHKVVEDPGEGVIKLGTDVHRVVDERSRALLRCDDLYVRSNEIVRVVRDGTPPPNFVRAGGAPSIRAVLPPTLLDELTRVAAFLKFDRREGKWMA